MGNDGSSAYERGVSAGVTSANYHEAYDGAGRDDSEKWMNPIPLSGPKLNTDREKWDYERGFEDGWTRYFDESVED